MANGRSYGRKRDSGRDSGRFMAMPLAVLTSPAYLGLRHPARSLLIEIAMQFNGHNNGQLLATDNHLSKRGWNSNSVIQRAKDALLAAELIFETVKGYRPNKASWYAITWQDLDTHKGYDSWAAKLFRRGMYRKNEGLNPSKGAAPCSLTPPGGARKVSPAPSGGAIQTGLPTSLTPPQRDHLEEPSPARIRVRAPETQSKPTEGSLTVQPRRRATLPAWLMGNH